MPYNRPAFSSLRKRHLGAFIADGTSPHLSYACSDGVLLSVGMEMEEALRILGWPRVFRRLAVPWVKKDYFRGKYGEQLLWFPDPLKYWAWVSNDDLPEELWAFLPPDIPSANIGPPLAVELIPRPCWGTNVRSYVAAHVWNMIKDHTVHAALCRCQACGMSGDRWSFDCHEVFEYDDRTRIQKLTALMSLCRFCHEAKHYGLAMRCGRGAEAFAQLRKVNGWNAAEAIEYLLKQFEICAERSNFLWTLDLKLLEQRFEISVAPELPEQRKIRADACYSRWVDDQRRTSNSRALREEPIPYDLSSDGLFLSSDVADNLEFYRLIRGFRRFEEASEGE